MGKGGGVGRVGLDVSRNDEEEFYVSGALKNEIVGHFCDSAWDAHKILEGMWGRIESVC